MDKNLLIGLKPLVDEILRSVKDNKQGKGKVFAVRGEAGFGKSNLIQGITKKINEADPKFITAITETQKPIGKFNVSNMQPLYPFSKLVEQLMERKHLSPEKRLARNVGMTALASIPFLGDVFYAAKELGRDWREYKREKSSAEEKGISSATADYFDTLLSFADKEPLFLCIDDMHWSDAQSIELLNLLADKIANLPITILFTYKESEIERQGLPLYSFTKKHSKETKSIKLIELKGFTKSELSELCTFKISNYKPNSEFENWIYEKSYGVPGVANEYVNYFSQYSPFDLEGNLVTNFEDNEFLPATVQALFSQHLDNINEEERNILSICAIEGREFTASIASQLLNTDVLSTIKKLRALQNKTGLIRSLGAKNRYGQKTTVYQFTQAYYQSFFEASLEYEEYTALHGQIASVLKEKYDDAANDNIKEEIAPYLAAHSSESGDEELTEDMLLYAAENAKKYGSSELIKDYFEQFKAINQNEEFDEGDIQQVNSFENLLKEVNLSSQNANGGNGEGISNGDSSEFDLDQETEVLEEELNTFEDYRNSILNDLIEDNYKSVLTKVESAFDDSELNFSDDESAQLFIFAARASTEIQDFDSAEENLSKAERLILGKESYTLEVLLYNAYALYYAKKELPDLAIEYLKRAVSLVSKISIEMKMLTISNISIIMKELSSEDSTSFFSAAKELAKKLDYPEFERELNNFS